MYTVTYRVRPATPVTEWRPSLTEALALARTLSGLPAVLAVSIITPEGQAFTAW